MGFEKSTISIVMICLVLDLFIRNVFKLPPILSVGFKFAVKKLLRFGIILLGIRFSALTIGIAGFMSVSFLGGLIIF